MLHRKLVNVLLVLVMSAMLAGPALAKEHRYIGSRKSNKYHYLDCRWAKKIKKKNEIFFESAKEAQDAGYVPCKVCRPPWKD